jgi:hypothetical protein
MLHASRPRFEQKYILIIAHILINAYSPAIWKQKFHKSGMLPRFSVAKELEHSADARARKHHRPHVEDDVNALNIDSITQVC